MKPPTPSKALRLGPAHTFGICLTRSTEREWAIGVVWTRARQAGWMSRQGHRLQSPDSNGVMICPESGYRYQEIEPGVLRCLNLDEEAPLPENLNKGTKSYKQLKEEASYACATTRS